MRRVSSVVGIAAALITMPLLGLPAWGAACPVSTPVIPDVIVVFNTMTGDTFCNVDGVTFSNVLTTSTKARSEPAQPLLSPI
jgi:hypothetical protein